MTFRIAKLWLCAAPTILCMIDYALTFCGQPPEYWAGDYSYAAEANPLIRWCLQQRPALAIAACGMWMLLVGMIIVVFPWRLAKFVSLAAVLGHGVGLDSWLNDWPASYWLSLPMLFGSDWLVVWTWERAELLRVRALALTEYECAERGAAADRPRD